ncbi:MAG: 50S ribosomal protein L25/general stress protein Ctc [Proteobacteria bacterium]|nr:50S ribosomal protein L25/general stress protein Ctc [Pseudomonadota bacterium]
MAEYTIIAAERRVRAGKGPARAARRAGRVPGVIYGTKKEPSLVTLDPRELDRELRTGAFLATVYDVQTGADKERVLPRDVQFDPVTDRVLHVDFLRVSAASTVTVQVPVNFLNEEHSPGLKRGGLLNVVRHEIEMICRADAIPPGVEVDLTGLEIGDSIHISMIALPDGVAPSITDRDFTVATIAAPTVVQEEAAAEGEEEEGLEGVELEEVEGEVPEGEAEEKKDGEERQG